MKEYKLIKKYPGLPIDWEVGMIVGTGDRQGQACFSPCSGKYTDKHIDHNDVINNPEYWEEIKQSSYEILSIDTRHWFGISTSKIDINTFLEKRPKDWEIHSVRRLSDREVFTLNVKVKFGREGNIIYFGLMDSEILVNIKYSPTTEYHNARLSDIKKLKPVLFTTEDGVDIREGDDYCYIEDMKVCKSQAMNIKYNTNLKTIIYFSTKEKAEEYILLNKPFLSITDIENIPTWDNLIEDLKKLVKSRL